jgi:phosphatidylglycerophosphatase A
MPLAPGTAGSAAGVALYWFLYQGGWFVPVAVFPIAAAAAVWSAGIVECDSGKIDPGEIVADELTGQLLCLLLIPPTGSHLLAGFLAFRVIDIAKPMHRLEALPGGWGVVADDVAAGALGWFALAGARGWGLL